MIPQKQPRSCRSEIFWTVGRLPSRHPYHAGHWGGCGNGCELQGLEPEMPVYRQRHMLANRAISIVPSSTYFYSNRAGRWRGALNKQKLLGVCIALRKHQYCNHNAKNPALGSSTRSSVDVQFSCWGCSSRRHPWTRLFEHLLPVLWAEFLGHMMILCSTIWGAAILPHSLWPDHFVFPLSMHGRSHFSISSGAFVIFHEKISFWWC